MLAPARDLGQDLVDQHSVTASNPKRRSQSAMERWNFNATP